jgi:Glycosyl hydrolase catalytic core.
MKRKLHFLVFLLMLQSHFMTAQDEHATTPCTSCNKYLYWTGEVNTDFFNERNWRLVVQLPSNPNLPDSLHSQPVRPSCLPGQNKMAHQICLVEPDLEKDRHPIPGTINAGEPIRYNLYAKNAVIAANGAIVFESDHIGFTMDGVALNLEGSLANGIVSITGSSTVHFREVNPLGENAIINLLDHESWVYLHEKNPDEVIAAASNLWVNDEVATIDGNFRVNQFYQKGSLLRVKSADYTPLTITSSTSSASLNESIIYAGNAIPAGLNNQTSSFVLKRGYMATFAINENGTGKSKVYIASEEDLTVTELPAALQGNVSFIRVLPWNWVTKKGNGGFKPGVDAGWFYNWGNGQTSKPNYEYVPMAWGAGGASSTGVNLVINKDKTTHLLGSMNLIIAMINLASSTTFVNRKWPLPIMKT